MLTDFKINRPVGTGHSRANDVIRIRKALNETGHGASPPEPSGVYDPSVQDSIESFQRDFGLKTDAIVEPGGPTERTIGLALAARRGDGATGQAHLRDGFKALQGADITFRTDPRGDSRSGAFRNADGALVSSQQMDAVLGNPAQTPSRQDREGEGPDRAAPANIAQTSPSPQAPQPKSDPNQKQGTGQSNIPPSAVAPTSPPTKTVIPVPGYRRDVLQGQGRAWKKWNELVRQSPKSSPVEARAYGEIFAAEGGDRKDPSSSAASGITQGTLDELAGKGFVQGIKPGTPPRQLSLEQRAAVYRGYFGFALSAVGGSAALSRIGNADAAAALADTLFRHGRTGGASIIQKAINGVSTNTNKVKVAGPVGKETLDAYARLAVDPATRRALLDQLAQQRTAAVPKGQETERIDHFRFQKASGSTGSK
jgi:peptidoglycan hydrolase-like protein with peptidoglycan-binding domain